MTATLKDETKSQVIENKKEVLNNEIIKIKDLRKIYKNGSLELEALKSINFTVKKDEFVAIMGKSGSGKSTLMNILGCLDTITHGQYLLDGENVSGLSQNRLADIRNKKIGFIFQSFNLLPKLTAQQNVELPMVYAGVSRTKRREAAQYALERVGLADRGHHRPNELSGGQRQRVAIARSLVNNPAILLADEPTGNLDSRSTEDVIAIFQQLNNEGSTIIIVTHEPEVAQHTKRIITFKDGQIITNENVENQLIAVGRPPSEIE